MQYNFKDKKVLITGAAGGIGRALCSKFIENGCVLICTSTNNDKLDKLKNEFGNNHFYYKLDLSDINNISENFNIILKQHNDIDILINNAAITDDNLFLRMKDDQWNEVIKVNLNSNFHIIKNLLPKMIKNNFYNFLTSLKLPTEPLNLTQAASICKKTEGTYLLASDGK